MAALVNGFEAGVTVGDGNAVVTGTSGYTGGNPFSLVSAGTSNTITYSAARKIQGAFGGLFTQGGTAASIVQLADVAGSAAFAARIYIDLMGGGNPAAGSLGIQVRSTTDTRIATAYIDAAGKVRINGPGATGDIAIGATAVNPAGIIRLEFTGASVGTASTAFTAAVYAGDSTTAVSSVSASSSTSTTGLADRARAGKINTGTLATFAVDTFGLTIGSNVPLGPAVTSYSDWLEDAAGGWTGFTWWIRDAGVWV